MHRYLVKPAVSFIAELFGSIGEVWWLVKVSNFWKAPKIQEVSSSNLKDSVPIPLNVCSFVS